MGKVTQEQVAGAEAPSALRAGLQGPSLPPNQQPRLPPNQGLTGGYVRRAGARGLTRRGYGLTPLTFCLRDGSRERRFQ